jgi:hypothetical protein
MFYDEHGNPSATGRYEKINGALRLRKSYVLHNGEHIGVDIMSMRDAASGSSGAVYLTDSGDHAATAKQIRDAARDSRYSGTDPRTGRPLASLPEAAPGSISTADTAAIAAAARSNRYR